MNDRQRIFVSEYIKCWNASEAARRAGYNGKSDVIGSRLLGDVSIKAIIDARLAEIKMSADEALVRLADQARVDIGDFAKYFNLDGTFDLQKAKDDGVSHLIKKLKLTQYGTELELHDKDFALDKIGKAHGLFNDKTTFDGELVFRIVRDERIQDSSAKTTSETE